MQILLTQDIVEHGVCTEDVLHMLKATNKRIYTEVYAPTLQEVMLLLVQARVAEASRQRTVQKWEMLINEFKDLTKE